MTATDILTSLRGTLPVVGTHRAWINLLIIAEAGEQGITRADLSQRTHNAPSRKTMARWEAAGLITSSRSRTRGCPVTSYRITIKGLALLRLRHPRS